MGDLIAILIVVIFVCCIVRSAMLAMRPEPATINARSNTTVRNTASTTGSVSNSTARIEPSETGVMVYYANNPHNSLDKEYRFKYKKVNNSWRAYIERMPSLNGRDGSGVVTHRLWEGDKPYVCWDSNVNTLHDIQTISRHWADCVQEYIATGKRFG